MALELEPLNVLIGANGSGKSNLIDVLGLLKALPLDLSRPLVEAGGLKQWLWKGREDNIRAAIESSWESGSGQPPTFHYIELGRLSDRAGVAVETIGANFGNRPGGGIDNDNQFNYINHLPEARKIRDVKDDRLVDVGDRDFHADQSILSQKRDTERYPFLSQLAESYRGIRLYRDWSFGRSSKIRGPQLADVQDEYLEEDSRNLNSILRRLNQNSDTAAKVTDTLKKVYEGIANYRVEFNNDYLYLYIVEEDGREISAIRLSDGTLRFLSLLAILCDPTPPRLVCIEEPELGLHPDLMATIADLLIEASSRTQLIVTTHSADLVSALWEFPEAVVVCEREIDGTTMKRLDRERLKKWLELYSLGELWASGEIGGNRW